MGGADRDGFDENVDFAAQSARNELAGFNAAVASLEDARANASMLSTKLDAVTEAWERQIEKTCGALVVEVGRSRTEGFFPRVGTRRGAEPPTPEPTDPTDGPHRR